MRPLTYSEMTFVSGGHDPDNPPKDIEIPEVIVTAQRSRNTYDAMMFSLLLQRVNYVVDDGPNHEEQCLLNNADPTLDTPPANVDVKDMRQAALLVQDYVKGQNQNIEWGAVLIADPSGNIRIGQISSGTADSVDMVAQLSAGEKIVGTVHSHPSTPGVDQSLPSTNASNGVGTPNDEANTLALIAAGHMDANGLIYIIDNATGQMHEYDPQNISTQNRNNITNDLQQYGTDCNY